YTKHFLFQGIINAFVSVDSFFLVSGLLVSYTTLRTMKARGGKMNWLYFYIHRYWRLTPPYMLLLLVYVPLFRYMGDGPMWLQQGTEYDYCRHSWYYNILYVNNIWRSDTAKQCMLWTWYLANDMQFYVISPLLIIPLYKSPLLGHILTILLLIVSMVTTAVLATINNYPAYYDLIPDAFNTIYIKPYTRISPYLVGILYGFHLNRNRGKIHINGTLSTVLWSLATISALCVVYGLYNIMNGVVVSQWVNVLYITLHKPVWGLCVGWVIFACYNGYGGYVNTLLSWKALVPLSRLTYCVYLVHPIVMVYYYFSQNYPVSGSMTVYVFQYFGILVASFMVAFVLSLAFEAPMLGLEKLLLIKLGLKKR
ncbi:hypothetical protein Ahia01_001401800, partial [Argonauta hians]